MAETSVINGGGDLEWYFWMLYGNCDDVDIDTMEAPDTVHGTPPADENYDILLD